MTRKNWIKFSVLAVIFFIYRSWFTLSPVSSGDWPYLFKETISSFSFRPDLSFLWLGPYYQWTSKIFVQFLNIPWDAYEKIFWFWMFLFLSIFSSYYFSKRLFSNNVSRAILILIFCVNSYILMIAGGGQMGVAISYSLAPFVFAGFLDLFEKESKKNILLCSVFLALQFMFDPRISLITIFAVFVYFFLNLLFRKAYFSVEFLIPLLVTFLFNSFWIIPLIANHSAVKDMYSLGQTGSLSFLSFAHFEETFSLLHPNWPENIFGKTHFFEYEFLILPITAFCSLAFVKDEEKEKLPKILFFAVLGIVGAFLSKGVNDPFGSAYSLFFKYIPGFSLFRDPTKFYLLIILSYSFLIPYSLEKLSRVFNKNFLAFIFLAVYIILHRQAFFGQLNGTFSPHAVPKDYISLKNFLLEDNSHSKTLWIPSRNPYSFYSSTHPFLEATAIFGTINGQTIKTIFNSSNNIKLLKKEQVRYIILEEDWEGKIFTDDGKYNETVYQSYLTSLKFIKNFKQKLSFGKIVVFEIQ